MRKLQKSLKLAILPIIATFLVEPAQADNHFSQQQKDFIATEKAFKSGDAATYQQLKQKLTHYPLYSYLEFEELSKLLTPANQAKIDQFVDMHPHSPLSDRLINRYIISLADNGHYDLMSHYYAPKYDDSKSAKLQCLYLQNQLNNGTKIDAIADKVGALWNVPKSQPSECDGLFASWSNAGYLDKNIAYERFYQTAQSGSSSLLKYISRFLPQNQQYVADLWVKAKSDPGVIAKKNFFPERDPNLEAPIVVYAIKKLAWGDRDATYRLWKSVKNRVPMTSEQKSEAERTLFLALATENKPQAWDWAKKHLNDYLDDELLNHWKLATYLRNDGWQQILEIFAVLPDDQKTSNQWRYWQAIALEKTGKSIEAQPLLNSIAMERDYYGYMAATRLKLPLQLNHQDAPISDAVFKQVSQSANIERAKELYAIERYVDASREFRSQIARMNSAEQIMAAAKIANQWGWYNQGILTIAKAKHWDDTEIRFPTAFSNDFKTMGKKVDLPPQWLMGVTRQESAYGPFAVSGANAYGLMQVLPSTAKIYSKRFGIPYSTSRDLFNPDTNIEMGSHYLKLRYDELDNNPIYASAAYNAGKHRIEKWKPFGRHSTDIWIEAIPYTETRDYIKRVMTYRQIYALKLGVKDDIFEYILNTKTGGI